MRPWSSSTRGQNDVQCEAVVSGMKETQGGQTLECTGLRVPERAADVWFSLSPHISPAKTAAEESVGCGIGEMERMAHYHNSNTANNQGENDGETAESGMQRRMSTYEDKWRERERREQK